MSEIKKLIERLCPEGVEYKKLGEVCNKVEKIKWKNITEEKKYIYVDLSSVDIRTHKISEDYVIEKNTAPSRAQQIIKTDDIIFGTTRPTLMRYSMIPYSLDGQICSTGYCVIRADKINVLARWIFHIVSSQSFYEYVNNNQQGAGYPSISDNSIFSLEIPVPPIEVQSKIVEILDNFTELEPELEAKLEAELEARRKQYEYYRNQLLTFDKVGGARFDVKWMTLGEIGEVCMCKRIMKHQTSDSGEIPFFKIGTFGGTPDAFINRELYEEYKSKFSYPKKGDRLISASGTIGRAVIFDGKDAYFQDSNIVWIDNDESILYNKYLYYLYSIIDWKTEGGTIKRLYNGNLKATKIAVPPLSEQQRIVSILDRFETLTTDLQSGLPAEIEARRKQYEYYREKLLTFKRKTA